jgi:hypothetical protein
LPISQKNSSDEQEGESWYTKQKRCIISCGVISVGRVTGRLFLIRAAITPKCSFFSLGKASKSVVMIELEGRLSLTETPTDERGQRTGCEVAYEIKVGQALALLLLFDSSDEHSPHEEHRRRGLTEDPRKER